MILDLPFRVPVSELPKNKFETVYRKSFDPSLERDRGFFFLMPYGYAKNLSNSNNVDFLFIES